MTRFHEKVIEGSEEQMYRVYARAYSDACAAYETINTTDEPNASILQILKYLDRVPFLEIHADWYKYLVNYPTCMRMDIDTLIFAESKMKELKEWLYLHGIVDN